MPNTRANHLKNIRKLIRQAQGTFRFPQVPTGSSPTPPHPTQPVVFTDLQLVDDATGIVDFSSQLIHNFLEHQEPEDQYWKYSGDVAKGFEIGPNAYSFNMYITGNGQHDQGLEPYFWKIVFLNKRMDNGVNEEYVVPPHSWYIVYPLYQEAVSYLQMQDYNGTTYLRGGTDVSPNPAVFKGYYFDSRVAMFDGIEIINRSE